MSKARNTGNLNNAIKISDTGAITFVSGSTTLMAVSPTGQLSGSAPVMSASFAQTAVTASYATSFTVTGNLTAQTLVVQTITSSVDFVTGSTRFGSIAGNTHEFTGSVSVSGSMGIGVIIPTTKLDIAADNNDSSLGQLRIKGSTSAAKILNIGYNTTSNYGFIQPLVAGTGYSNLILNPDGGNVGIGTTNPLKNLHIYASNASGLGIGRNLTSDNFSANIFFYPSALSSDKRNWAITTYYDRPELLQFRRSTTTTSDPYESGTTIMTLDALNDRVGIGTVSPNSLLNVVGNSATNGLTIKSAGNGGTFPFRVTWSGGTDGDIFTITDTPRVGVCTTSPLERFFVSNTGGSTGIGVQTISSGDPYLRFYDNTTIKADTWWDRSGGFMGINSLGSGSKTALNPFGGNIALGTSSTSTYSRVNLSGSLKINRSIINWYYGAWQGNSTYWHMKTNMWGGGSPNGNTQYTMSYFKGYSYSYSGNILEGAVGFHNYNGLIYSYKSTGNIFSNVYVSSDGYVVLVVPSGSGETGINIDWYQHWEYPFVEAIVTAAGLHGTTTGKY